MTVHIFFEWPRNLSHTVASPYLRATGILSTGDFPQTVDKLKALAACHLFSVAGKPVVSRAKATYSRAGEPFRQHVSMGVLKINVRSLILPQLLLIAELLLMNITVI